MLNARGEGGGGLRNKASIFRECTRAGVFKYPVPWVEELEG